MEGAAMSYDKPEGWNRLVGRAVPCACGDDSHRNRRRVKKEASKWMRLQYKKLGDDAPRKLRYRPHYC